ncbi:MAG: chromosome segregation protein [Thermoleophilaceae bacterium]|nr:chromosome segregation protein [Thermoleophilaceae bacterium]
MHLRSIVVKGFKSFPDRVRLDFAPGVSVVVGPNGSGKSNITDAVLWALGEQSPLAVRGQTMQDVIFAGGHGIPSRNAAEVEVVIDNNDGGLATEFSEISIQRRLDRSGEGEYRLNGARCRLVDVIEVLSDTGLGKEMHSVVSQGRVEAIIHSKPRDRRLLIEEAAGLGKHRKRRRRAQLKLERTQDNIARALDVEREARSRLRPLKRQAEAAELHARLERQSLEARLELARDAAGTAARELEAAEAAARSAGAERDEADRLLAAVAVRRERAEEAFAAASRYREELTGRVFAARSAYDRIGMRQERALDLARRTSAAAAEAEAQRVALTERDVAEPADSAAAERVAALEAELATVEAELARTLDDELAGLDAERERAVARRDELEAVVAERRERVDAAERAADESRRARVEADRAVEAARRAAAETGAELAGVNRFLSAAAAAPEGVRSLAGDLGVEPGHEAAVAAALGPLLRAALSSSIAEASDLLDRAGEEGGVALLAGPSPSDLVAIVHDIRASEQPGAENAAPAGSSPQPPCAGATPLLEVIDPAPEHAAVLQRLLRNAWLVPDLSSVPSDFPGIAATATGRAYFGATGEIRQAAAGGEERILEERNRRDRLVAATEAAARAEASAQSAAESAQGAVAEAWSARDAAEGELRAATRERDEAAEAARRTGWLIERRREAPGDGPAAVRRAEIVAELRAETRLAEQAERARAERRARIDSLTARAERDRGTAAAAERAATALGAAKEAMALRRDASSRELEADEERGRATADELRSCAREEAELQGRLRKAMEAVTATEVRAQQARDAASERETDRRAVAEALGHDPAAGLAAPLTEPLPGETCTELTVKVDRLARRREQLGPVNPLAKQEYEEAVEHVEELESQRSDLESALTELESLIKETDRRIRESFEETFEAAARNFEDVVAHLFPGGRGRLRLVRPDAGPRPVLGGEDSEPDAATGEIGATVATSQPDTEAGIDADDTAPEPGDPGVEIEVTPAGKSMKRLSLMSGGEKSLVALAFMFAVFLARPCPFYILDEVEAALDDANIDRFLQLLRRYCDRAQFIVVTHQKRTMDAADCIYGVSMAGNGVSKVISRRMPREAEPGDADTEPAAEAGDSVPEPPGRRFTRETAEDQAAA